MTTAPLDRIDSAVHAKIEELAVRRIPALEEERDLRLDLVHDAPSGKDVENDGPDHLLDEVSLPFRVHIKLEAISGTNQRRGDVLAHRDLLIPKRQQVSKRLHLGDELASLARR